MSSNLFKNLKLLSFEINTVEKYLNLNEKDKNNLIESNYNCISKFCHLIDIQHFHYSRFIIFDIINLDINIYNQILIIVLLNCIYYSKPIIIIKEEPNINEDDENIKRLEYIFNIIKNKKLGCIIYNKNLSNIDFNKKIKKFLTNYNTFFS